MPQQATPSRRRKGVAPPRRRDNTPLYVIGGLAILLVALLLIIPGVMAILNAGQPSSPGPVNTSGRTWGNPNAKVTIDEWSDFQ